MYVCMGTQKVDVYYNYQTFLLGSRFKLKTKTAITSTCTRCHRMLSLLEYHAPFVFWRLWSLAPPYCSLPLLQDGDGVQATQNNTTVNLITIESFDLFFINFTMTIFIFDYVCAIMCFNIAMVPSFLEQKKIKTQEINKKPA